MRSRVSQIVRYSGCTLQITRIRLYEQVVGYLSGGSDGEVVWVEWIEGEGDDLAALLDDGGQGEMFPVQGVLTRLLRRLPVPDLRRLEHPSFLCSQTKQSQITSSI